MKQPLTEKEIETLNRMLAFIAIALVVLMCMTMCGCSHNPLMLTIGKKATLGNVEYGEISYIDGFGLLDVSRENSSWELEIDDEAGLSYDAETKTLKGVRKIKRNIGAQITGYLVELAEKCPELAEIYLRAMLRMQNAELD